jgi:alpha-tubulin suppressor-like RCC1 family protein
MQGEAGMGPCWGADNAQAFRSDDRRRRFATLALLCGALLVASHGALAQSMQQKIAAGGVHSCALISAGAAKCWGQNVAGELGDGNNTVSNVPVDVNGLTTSAIAIVGGFGHTCALTSTGGVKCWGWNDKGQLGVGNNTDSNVPLDVSGLTSGVVAVAAGVQHTCAITSAGGVKCWGLNAYGELGTGTNIGSRVPVDVSGLATGVVSIAAGEFHTCAVTNAGGVKCWGQNDKGQLGNDNNIDSYVPVDVTGLPIGGVTVAAGGDHSCAVTNAGGVKCWGNNDKGQLGNDSNINSNVPVDVSGLSGVIAITTGYWHTCAVTGLGAAKCWGGNDKGQLGNGNNTNSNVPVDVSGLATGVAAVAAGFEHACALSTAGAAKCWGLNNYGQLGNGSNADSNVPVAVGGFIYIVPIVPLQQNIAGGGSQSCALTNAGAAKCWGGNIAGQLGNGSNTGSNVPVNVSGLSAGVVAIAAGGGQTCAVTSAGAAKCWGLNDWGQLGNGNHDNSTVPVDVSGLTSGVVAIAAGRYHTCALTSAGGVKCWGYNGSGQLGDGNNANSNVPVNVSGLTGGVVAIASGDAHTCALTSAGAAKCWGNNDKGQLGNGNNTDSNVPVNVSGLTSGVVAIGAGFEHSCASTGVGAAKCWGENYLGQLGNGNNTRSNVPVDVSGLTSGVVAVAVGGYQTCALTSAGGVKCWGDNGYGQLGNGNNSASYVPVNVSGLSTGVVAIAAGSVHTCALTKAGGAMCWGWNQYGSLGNGSNANSNVPVAVSGFIYIVRQNIAAGQLHTCALTSAGAAKCWGLNDRGQLGNGNNANSNVPVNVSGLTSGFVALAAGGYHTCAVTSAGGAMCWGSNQYGSLGNGSIINSNVPVNVSGLTTGVVSVAAGLFHSCALTSAGGVKCWGHNDWGQLGNGNNTDSNVPVDVSGLTSGVVTIAAGYDQACAVTSAGAAKCWGLNLFGELGNGNNTNSNVPVDVSGLTSGIVPVVVGSNHTCALTNAGAAKCWGENIVGQLGNGNNTDSNVPVNVSGLTSGVVAVGAGGYHSCSLTNAGGVKCWGYNRAGQLGNGSDTGTNLPVNVSGLSSGVVAIAAGQLHTCALTSAGAAKCWGFNDRGQLGNGSNTDSNVPVDVRDF